MKIRTFLSIVALTLFATTALAWDDSSTRIAPVADENGEYQDATYVERSYSLGTYMDNPCTAAEDYVLVDYNVDLLEQHLSMARFHFDENTAMSSSTYNASGTSQQDVGYGQTFTLRQYHKVNTYDDFHVVTVIDFDPASKSSSVYIETACGDGSPSSAK